MSTSELAKEIAKNHKITQIEAHQILKTAIQIIIKNILAGHIVKLDGLCSMRVDVLKERKFRNLQTGEVYVAPKRFGFKQILSRNLKKIIDAKKIA